MSRQTVLVLGAIFTFAALPPSAFPQGAVEYGIITSGAATSAAKTGSAINRGTKGLAGRLQGTMGKSVESTEDKTYRIANTMEENKKKLEEKSQAGGGTIHVDSVPAKATVLVDGDRVAYTPADLKIPGGKHNIEVTDPTHLPWHKEITLSRGESISLKPTLEKKYKSEMILSIQQ